MNLSNSVDRKFIESYSVDEYEILTDSGWKDIKNIHKTIPYQVWTLKTTNHILQAADTHIVFTEDGNEIFLKDIKPGLKILTESGAETVINIEQTDHMQNMYDLEVDSKNHTYFANGILSHNSTSYTIFCLWYALLNKDKKILICANKFKTAKDILARIKLAYEMLPNWLKPGIVVWNASEIEFSNGCKISAEATSESSGRGRIN